MITTITNGKGGVFNTATVISYAHYLARSGKSSAILDFDYQADATKSLGIAPAPHMADFLEGDEPIFQPSDNSRNGLQIVASDGTLKGYENGVSSRPISEQKRVFERIARRINDKCQFDNVVIDTSKKGALQESAVIAADVVIVPTTLDYNASSNTIAMVNACANWNPNALIFVLPVGLDNRQAGYNLEVIGMISEEIHGNTSAKVYNGGIVQSAAFKRAGFSGKTVWESSDFNLVAESYLAFFNWLEVA